MMLAHRCSLRQVASLTPVIVFVCVFLGHIPLVLTHDYSIHGGGLFGMFSTLDSRAHRELTGTVRSNSGAVQLNLEPYRPAIDSVLAFPTPERIRVFAAYVACSSSELKPKDRITLTYRKDAQAELGYVPQTYAFTLENLCIG